MPNFALKSGKEVFEVEHSAEESFEDFQAKVFAVTDVPPKNLKILFKGKMIKVILDQLRMQQHSWLSPLEHSLL